MNAKAKALSVSMLCIASAINAQAFAQDMTVADQLNFGVFAVTDNTAPRAIVVTPDNDTFPDAEIVMDQLGQAGVYNFTGLPPNVSFFLGVDVPNPPTEGGVVFDDTATLSVGGGEDFTVDTFTIGNSGILQTDGAGAATMTMGATLHTSGNGGTYTGGSYAGQAAFTLYY